jgi:hypothetical protein
VVSWNDVRDLQLEEGDKGPALDEELTTSNVEVFCVEEEEAPLSLEDEGSGMSGSVFSFSSELRDKVRADEVTKSRGEAAGGGVVGFDTGASEAGRVGTESAATVS